MPSPAYIVTLHTGRHPRRQCPITLDLPGLSPEESWGLVSKDGETLPLQHLHGETFACILPNHPANLTIECTVQAQDTALAQEPTVHLNDDGTGINILLRERLFTRYCYKNVPARPYFFPLMTSEGIPITRAYPMQPDIPDETKDHKHHRSLWIAFGEVNGADNWSEEEGHGYTLHTSLDAMTNGTVFGRFTTTSDWTNADKSPLLTQTLTVTAWATETIRLLDLHVQLTANYGAALFGDTKEGGILSARVASALDVDRGGRIENVYGGIDEGETWGKAAHWCDYSGRIENRHVGIAIMDHPHSFRYPTHWHVRNYGLMTANPFGYSYFTNGVKNGQHRLDEGETLNFQYRILLHPEDAREGKVNAHYLDFVSPPNARVLPA